MTVEGTSTGFILLTLFGLSFAVDWVCHVYAPRRRR